MKGEKNDQQDFWQHPNISIGDNVSIAPSVAIHGSIRGTNIVIGEGSEIYDNVVIRCVGGNGDIKMGQYCYINPGSVLYSGNGITMGDYVLLAPGVIVVPTNHAIDRRDIPIRHQGFAPSKGGVVIRNDVWVGANSVLLDGVIIGDGAVIAAGSVVNCEVPPFEVWGGTPARKIGERPDKKPDQ